MLVHRHWMWANVSRRWFVQEKQAGVPVSPDHIAGSAVFGMYLWYAMLWGVIEAITKLRVRLHGRFRDDLRQLREPLRDGRNAIFHVSTAYYDARLFAIMQDPGSVGRIWRVHEGFGRMFLEEIAARRAEVDTMHTLADEPLPDAAASRLAGSGDGAEIHEVTRAVNPRRSTST